jgi:exopolysaccharide production protein ExoQ
MVLSFIVFSMLCSSAPQWNWLCVVFAGLSAILVFLSDSTTCIVILCILVCIMTWRHFTRWWTPSARRMALVLGCVAVAGFVLTGSAFWREIPSALEASQNFMNRIAIWAVSLSMVRDKLWLGYGYGGFWVFGGPAQTMWDSLALDPQDASYAHNGYLQVLVDGGIVGLGLLLGLLFITLRRAWRYFRATHNSWPLYFFVFLMLHNLTEGTFVLRNNVCWLLFVAVAVQLGRAYPTPVNDSLPVREAYEHA